MSGSYFHPQDNNLTNLHKAMQYGNDGLPEVRVSSRFDTQNVTINIGSSVSVDNFPAVQVVSGNVNVDNFPAVQTISGNIGYSDSEAMTAFGRLRIAGAQLINEFRSFYGTTGNVEILNSTVGSGTVIPNLTQKYVTLSLGTASGDRAIRQSRQYHSYISGSSTIAFISFAFGAGKVNLHQYAGMFDIDNGIFLRMNGTTPQFGIRKGGVDATVNQSAWNVDKLDGTGPSGLTIDFSKAQILVIDYQWLGIGRVRVGFDVNGQIVYSHYFNHFNNVDEPYSYQPSLPVRYEISNTGGSTSSSSSMKSICFGVYTESTETESGFLNSVSNDTTAVPVTTTAAHGIIAIRLRNTVNSIPVKAFARLRNWSIMTNENILYKILILQNSSTIVGTPTWSPCTPTGWCEYTTNFTLVSDPGPNTIVLHSDYVSTGQGSASGMVHSAVRDRSATIFQNIDSTDSMIIALVAYKLGSNASVYASLNWTEIK